MPLCASLLMVQGTFSLLPLVVIEYFQLIYLIKSNADWRHPKSKFWLFFIKYLLILTEVMVKYYLYDSYYAYVDLSTVLWIIDALVYKSFKHHKVYIDLIKVSLLLPGLVFWIKNYKFAALPTDPTFIPALLTILACFSENMQHEFNIPRKNSKSSLHSKSGDNRTNRNDLGLFWIWKDLVFYYHVLLSLVYIVL